MNMTKENRAEIKRLRSEDKLALGELKIINRNVRIALTPTVRHLKGLKSRIDTMIREASADVQGVHAKRARIAKRIAILTGRNS